MGEQHDKPQTAAERAHWEQAERRERNLWRSSFIIITLLSIGLGITSWSSIRALPQRLEALPIGLVVLVGLFGFYVWHQRREVSELRGYQRGMQESASKPPSEEQIEKLLDVVARSQHGYRELIDSLDHIVFNASLDGELKVVNRRFTDMLNLSFNDVVRHSIGEFFSEPTKELAQTIMPLFREKRSWTGIVKAKIRRTGDIRYFDAVLQPILKGDDVVAISGVARDVTAQRQTELRFTELFESLQEGVYFSTAEGKMLEANPALVKMLGYDNKEELMLVNKSAIYEDPAHRGWKVAELEKTGSIRNFEVTLVGKNGQKIRCLDSCSAIRDGAGKISRIQGTLVDITERVEIERRLQREQEFGRRLVECFPDLIIALDAEGKFTFVSPRSEQFVGLPPGRLLGNTVGERAHPEDIAHVQQEFHSVISGQKPSVRFEYRLKHADGSWRTARVSASPLMAGDGKIIGAVASARDVTEEKHLEGQLQPTEKFAAMGQMLAGVAHELNNPLTAILGVSDLLRERAADESMRRQADLVRQQARRAADIVQSLLAFSRRAAPGRTPVQVEQLIERVLQLHGGTLNKKHIEFEFKPTPDLPPVQGDASLLLQVFMNLVINSEQAISAVRDHGKIQITAIRLESNVVVTFDDDGPGIPPEILSRIFDPFFTTKRPGGGTGLGLTISMAIIREHGGTIEAHSAPGRGASIKMILPVASTVAFALGTTDSAALSAQARQVVPSLQGHSVLVVDDEDGIRELVSEGLAARGMAVETVSSCEEALAILSIRQFDVILCDYNLPGMNGEELFQRLSALGSTPARFIFMTGDMLDASAIDSYRALGARAIQKPFQLSGLASVLTEVLEAQPVKIA
jgi:PAS domain S-box-containing protein